MAVYKVIQDVEAEDKLLGPLTLKAFVYAAIAALCAFIEYRLLLIGTPLKWLFILLFLGPMVLFGVLASPLGREQPTEVWLLSKIRFFLKPRQRIWDQEGQQNLVTVTAPKKIELHLTKDLSQTEVQSRLKTLASTLDTRGWAIKNADVDLGMPDSATIIRPSDRLIGETGLPREMPVVDVRAADDILDEKNNPTAQKFEAMMQQAAAERKHSLLSKLKILSDEDSGDAKPKKSKKGVRRVIDTKGLPAVKNALKSLKKEAAAERAHRAKAEKTEFEDRLAKARSSFSDEFGREHAKSKSHKLVDARPPEKPTPPAAPPPQAAPVTSARQTANIELAQSGSAFSVATLSQLANRQPQAQQTGPNEVTISLH